MGAIRKIFSGVAGVFDTVRKVLHFFVLIVMFFVIIGLFSGEPPTPMPAKGALLVNPAGSLVDQLSGDPVDRAFAQISGDLEAETLVRDLVAAIRHAKTDDSINSMVLDLGSLAGGGLTKLEYVADAIADFKTSGKKVLAYGDYYTQGQYYLAAHADEVYMHPSGVLFFDGYGRFRSYFKQAIDKLSIDWNIFKVGEFKSFVEPYFRDSMSDEDRESSSVWLGQLWRAYQDQVVAARSMDRSAIADYAEQLPERLAARNGDVAAVALDAKFVDALWTRDKFASHVESIAGKNERSKKFNRVALADYIANRGINAQITAKKGNQIGVIVASGQILDGNQPPGAIGGDSLAAVIRTARNDDSLKALVLQIDSGGGSKFASEVIQRELLLFKETNRPLITIMSSVAASGGYWIAMDGDEIWASPNTISGSIGIGGYFPTVQRGLDRLGVHVDGVGTTRWSGDFRPDRGLSESAINVLQSAIEYGYQQFITTVAQARGMDVDAVDRVARGRVWSGYDAKALGLIDRMGNIDDAVAAAAERAGLGANYSVRYIEKELSFKEQLATMFAAKARVWFADIVPDSGAGELQRIGSALGLDAVRAEFAALARFNDPRGLYAYCVCRVE